MKIRISDTDKPLSEYPEDTIFIWDEGEYEGGFMAELDRIIKKEREESEKKKANKDKPISE